MTPEDDTQVELDDGPGGGDVGTETTADAPDGLLRLGLAEVLVRAEGGTVPMIAPDPAVKDTVEGDTATPWAPAPSEGSLSLEQYAYLYAQQLAGEDKLAAALQETGLSAGAYAAWRTHWESRMMHNGSERDRFFALVTKLRD